MTPRLDHSNAANHRDTNGHYATEMEPKAVADRQYAVVLHDDRQHTLKYCKALLREVFALSDTAATVVTWVINTEGRSIAWTGDYEVAAELCDKVEAFQRLLDERGDAAMFHLDRGHPPMRTTIEQVPRNNNGSGNGHVDQALIFEEDGVKMTPSGENADSSFSS